jgi:ribosomal protein S18 acetylase RimI-like enzyme
MHPLDNVIWEALTTRQAEFAESCDQALAFVPEVNSLAAFREPTTRGYESLAGLLDSGRTVTLALESPYQPWAGLKLVVGAPGLQMVYENGGVASAADSGVRPADSPFDSAQGRRGRLFPHKFQEVAPEILELGAANAPEMMELTKLTKPGPFHQRTYELGRYVGIRCDGKLVAMAGERLKVPGYTEVSAVCTHPEHTGRGYARILMTEVMRTILGRGETPFLHVRESNVRAIELYKHLGFSQRVRLHMTVLRKDSA